MNFNKIFNKAPVSTEGNKNENVLEDVLTPEEEAKKTELINKTNKLAEEVSKISKEDILKMDIEKQKKILSVLKTVAIVCAALGVAVALPQLGSMDEVSSLPEHLKADMDLMKASVQEGVGVGLAVIGFIGAGITQVLKKIYEEQEQKLLKKQRISG